MRRLHLLMAGAALCHPLVTHADQPIMNMMPRWDGGWGLQLLHQWTQRDDLMTSDDVIHPGFREEIEQLSLEGVYTWDRSVRVTFKLPYVVDAWREVPGNQNQKVLQRDAGIGDLTLALPLKRYFNLDGRSGSWTLAPQLRIPLKDRGRDDYDVWDRTWGGGLSFGYETETYDWYIGTGVSLWAFEDSEPFEAGASLDLGWNFRDNAALFWENDIKWEDDGTLFYAAGPALYWRFTTEIHGRIEWKHDFHSQVGDDELDHGNGDTFKVGIGFVY